MKSTGTIRFDAISLVGISLAVIAISIFFFLEERENQRERLGSELRTITSSFSARLETQLSHRINAGRLLGHHYHQNGASNAEEFRYEASVIHELFGDFQALNWVDVDGIIRIVTPELGNEAALGLNLNQLPHPSTALTRARETVNLQITPPINLAQGGQGFTAYIPLTRDGVAEGFVNVVFRIAPLMHGILENIPEQTYHVLVLDGNATVFSSSQAAAEGAETVTNKILIGPREWTVVVAPTSTGLRAVNTLVDEVILVLGIITVFLIASLGTLVMRRQVDLRKREDGNARLANAVEHLDDSFSLWDDDDRMVFGNHVFRNLCVDIPDHIVAGTRFEDFLRASIDAGHMPDLDGRHEEFIRSSIIRRFDWDAEPFDVERSDGIILRVREQRLDGGGIVAVGQDVTEQRRNEKALRSSEERLALAIRQLSVWDWDLQTDTLYMSPGFFEQLGYTYKEFETIKASSVADIIHPDDVENYRNNLARHLEYPTTIFSNEHRFRTKSGDYRWFLAVGHAMADADGKAYRSTGVLSDISERIDLQSQLSQAQKMEAIGQLTGGIAHDFNNLLAVIQGNAELLEELGGERSTETSAIIRASERGAELTQRLLAFSRQQPLNPEVVDVSKLVSSMSELLKRTLGETIEIQAPSQEFSWRALADPGQVENALLNLAINARDAMPNGGKVTIECTNMSLDHDSAAKLSNLSARDYVVLSVTDHGTGMSKETQSHAFEPFYTTKETGQGSGLGLSMVYGFAHQSGGQATIYSELGKGTTVKLYLPRALAEADRIEKPQKEAVPRGDGETILVIEDDPQVRELAEMMLKNLGYRVVSSENIDAARQTVEAHPEIALVLSDVVLPGGTSGPEFADELRATHPDLTTIFMSGYPAEAAKRNGFLGSDRVLLNKPFKISELAKAVKNATG